MFDRSEKVEKVSTVIVVNLVVALTNEKYVRRLLDLVCVRNSILNAVLDYQGDVFPCSEQIARSREGC